jgi:SAM-dependent methyltransferase
MLKDFRLDDAHQTLQLFEPTLPATTALQDRFQFVQVEFAVAQELTWFYASPQWRKATRVLDLGCGSGRYLWRLSERFPEKQYVGVDHNAALIALARDRYAATNRTFVHADYLHLSGDFDFVIARLFVQYLDEIEGFLEATAKLLPTGSLLVVDADDRKRFFSPSVPALSAFFESYRQRQRSLGLDRDRVLELSVSMSTESTDHKFVVGMRDELIIPSTLGQNLELFREAYALMLNLADASGLHLRDTVAARDEWASWISDPRAYTQIGLIALRLDRAGA